MAWTAPRTWVASEVVTAALMNTHVRDNLLETAPAKVTAAGQTIWSTAANAIAAVQQRILKASDETVSASTTYQADDELVWPILANEKWHLTFYLWMTGTGTGGSKMRMTGPTGFAGWANTHGGDPTSGLGDTLPATADVTTKVYDGWSQPNNTNPDWFVTIEAYVTATANGNITLEWAQNAANGTTVMKAGSHIIGVRLA